MKINKMIVFITKNHYHNNLDQIFILKQAIFLYLNKGFSKKQCSFLLSYILPILLSTSADIFSLETNTFIFSNENHL